MHPVAFTWDTSVDIRFDIRTNPEAEPEIEDFTVDIRLHCEGIPGEPEHIPPYDRPELYDPGSGPEITLERVEIRTELGKDVFRPAVAACYPDANDAAVIRAAEALVDSQPDGLVEALRDACEPDMERG